MRQEDQQQQQQQRQPIRPGRVLPHNDSRQVVAAVFWEAGGGTPRARRPRGAKPKTHVQRNKALVQQRSEHNRLAKLSQESEVAVHAAAAPLAARSSCKGVPQEQQPRRHSGSGSSGRDFVRENAAAAAHASRRRSSPGSSEQQQAPAHMRAAGTVPTYLLRRKMELAQQYAEQLAEKERALIPPGMRILAEEERLETLVRLQALREGAEKALQALPFVAETVSQRRHQEQLEAQLAEVEDAIRTFSRSKVLVEA